MVNLKLEKTKNIRDINMLRINTIMQYQIDNKLNNIDKLFKIYPKVVYVQCYCNIFTSGIL